VDAELQSYGYEPTYQAYEADGTTVRNIIVERPGRTRPEEILVVGAHYDTDLDSPGADDNASGVAGLLEMARLYSGHSTERTLRFAFFANEEMPYFGTEEMGSMVYARSCRRRGDHIVGAIILESIGYYSTEEGSQDYPVPFNLLYPDTGDFIAFVGSTEHDDLVKECVRIFRGLEVKMPSEGGAMPPFVKAAQLSDHSSFWEVGYPALMVTDTAPYRNPHYHQPTDLPDTLDYGRAARVTVGIALVVADLAGLVSPR
jgi:Zn-dependent M28 family amino/carboxypeptidase